MKTWARLIGASIGTALGVYGGWAAVSYARYGGPHQRRRSEHDELLDRFIPVYDVYERHTIIVNAPAEVTLAAARDQNIFDTPLIKATEQSLATTAPSPPPSGPLQQPAR